MTFKGVISGRSTISVSDGQSGLSSILITTASNANVRMPEIIGQTIPVNVTYTKIDSTQSSTLSLQATDIEGNVSLYDPWDITVSRTPGKPVLVTSLCAAEDLGLFPNTYNCKKIGAPRNHPYLENKVEVRNGPLPTDPGDPVDPLPGLTNLRIQVNGTMFQVGGLKDGEKRMIDISAAMKTDNANVFSVEALGKPGGHAMVTFRSPNPGESGGTLGKK